MTGVVDRTPGEGAEHGEIFDIGYQRYQGGRLGRGRVFLTLVYQSLRQIFGFGRGIRAHAAPLGIFAIVLFPALVQMVIGAAVGNEVRIFPHERYFNNIAWLFALFCATQAPELLGSDRLHGVLPLYFSRALERVDYIGARLLAMVLSLLMLIAVPHTLLLLGRVLNEDSPWAALRAEAHLFGPIFASSLLVATMFSAVGLFLSSIVTRRFLASAAIAGALLITSALASGIIMSTRGELRWIVLGSPLLIGDGLTFWLFGATAPQRNPIGLAALPGEAYLAGAIGITLVFGALTVLRYLRLRV